MTTAETPGFDEGYHHKLVEGKERLADEKQDLLREIELDGEDLTDVQRAELRLYDELLAGQEAAIQDERGHIPGPDLS